MALLRQVRDHPISIVAEVAIKSVDGEQRGARLTMFGAEDATLEFYAPVFVDSLRIPGFGFHLRFQRIRLPLLTVRNIWFISFEGVRLVSEESEIVEIWGTYNGNKVFINVPKNTLKKGVLNVLEP